MLESGWVHAPENPSIDARSKRAFPFKWGAFFFKVALWYGLCSGKVYLIASCYSIVGFIYGIFLNLFFWSYKNG